MTAPSAQMIYSTSALLCAAIGSAFDIRQRRIPNVLCSLSVLAGLFLHATMGGWIQLGSSALAGLTGGAIFLLFYLAGGMGAGDVKLMIAVGCLVGLSPLALVLIATAIAGAGFALAMAVQHGRLRPTLRNVVSIVAHHGREGLTPHPELNLGDRRALRLPFALPIMAGCLAAVFAIGYRG